MQTSNFDEIELITLVGQGPKLSVELPTPIHLDRDNYEYQMGLHSFQIYNSIPNITKNKNSSLKITPGKTKKVVYVTLDNGAYEIARINIAILNELKMAGVKEPEKNFKLAADLSTFKSYIELGEGWKVNFYVDNSIAPVLGFKKTQAFAGAGLFKSPNIVRINTVNSLLFHTNITEPSMLNHKYVPYIYIYSINIGPGFNVVKRVPFILYKNLTTNVLSNISVWVTDEKEQLIDFNREQLTVELCLRRRLKPNSIKTSDGSFR